MSQASKVLWTYTDRDGVVREWTQQQQDEHAAAMRQQSEWLEQHDPRRDEPIGGPGGD